MATYNTLTGIPNCTLAISAQPKLLTAWDESCFSDAAGTTPAVDRGAVACVTDQVAGRLVAQATANNRPTLHDGLRDSEGRAVAFVRTPDDAGAYEGNVKYLTVPVGHTFNARSGWMFCCVDMADPVYTSGMLWNPSNGGDYAYGGASFYGQDHPTYGAKVKVPSMLTDGAGTNLQATNLRFHSARGIYGFVGTGSECTIFADGRSQAMGRALQNLTAMTGAQIGAWASGGGSYNFAGRLRALVAGSGTSPDTDAIQSVLRRLCNCPDYTQTRLSVFPIGDSIPVGARAAGRAAGSASSDLGTWIQTLPWHTIGARVFPCCESGWILQSGFSNSLYDKFIDPTWRLQGQLAVNTDQKIIILQAGCNDLWGGASAATVYGYIKNMVARCRGIGARVIYVTPTDRASAGYQTELALLGQMCIDNPPADDLVTLHKDPRFGLATTMSNPRHSAEGTHWTNYVHHELKWDIFAAVQRQTAVLTRPRKKVIVRRAG